MGSLGEEEFWGWFEEFEDTAFRLERRDRYAVDEEREPMRRFLAGELADDLWFMDFYEAVRRWRGSLSCTSTAVTSWWEWKR